MARCQLGTERRIANAPGVDTQARFRERATTMTSFDVIAVYQHGRLEITIPAHNQFFIDLFKALPLRCVTFRGGFSLEHPKVEIHIQGGHEHDAELIFARHFPFAPVIGGVR